MAKPTISFFPYVPSAFAMDINRQEYLQATGLSNQDEAYYIGPICKGNWSNNWVWGCDWV